LERSTHTIAASSGCRVKLAGSHILFTCGEGKCVSEKCGKIVLEKKCVWKEACACA